MGPRKSRTRQSNQHINSSDLDLDSDAPIISQDVPSAEPLPVRTNDELNLAVIKRHNQEIQTILSIAPFAVIYEFSTVSQSWVKSGIEGTLFVCQLDFTETNVERYLIFVLNRRGLENFQFEPKSEADVDVSDQYVMLMDSHAVGEENDSPVYGLWIYAAEGSSSTAQMRDINAGLIKDCATRAEASQNLASGDVALASPQISSVPILSQTAQVGGGSPIGIATDGNQMPSLLDLLQKSKSQQQDMYHSRPFDSDAPGQVGMFTQYPPLESLHQAYPVSGSNVMSSQTAYDTAPPSLNVIDSLFANIRQGNRASG